MQVRRASVAGQFYPADKEELEREINKYIVKGKKENVKAGIVPHAGYVFSGKLTGEVFSKIKEKNTFIILGVNHYGIGEKIVFSERDFEIPLRIVKNNRALGKRLFKKLEKDFDVEVNELAHEKEHSIEVELPFLKKARIVPVLLQDLSYEECKNLAEIISEFISNDVGLIVSSDFTHYGFSYGFVPFTSNIKENIYKIDNKIIEKILMRNASEVYKLASKTTVCGLYGITIATRIASILKLKPKLVDYYTSGDIVGYGGGAVVGYAGLIFK